MFKKMKLKKYLLTVFSVIILLSAIMTTVSTVGFLKTKGSMNVFIDDVLGAETAVSTCRIEANIAARELREMVITEDPQRRKELKNRIDEAIKNIHEAIRTFKATYGEEDGLAKQYEDVFTRWFDIASNVMAEIDAGNKDKAIKMIQSECSPALRDMVGIVKQISAKTEEQKITSEKHTQAMIMALIIITAVLFLIVAVFSIIFAAKTTNNIVGGTKQLQDVVYELSKGNLHANMDYEGENEFADLAERLNFSLKELAKYVETIDYTMTEFSKGNFAAETSVEFLGDFAHIQKSVGEFQFKMNDTLREMDEASAQVNAGSNQVASGSQALAQGATEQASSVQELSDTITEISSQITQTAEFSKNANELGVQAGEVIEKSRLEMNQMMEAIKDIAVSSENIQKIIKVIDDIAFQTNILALNAAVEAARAGSAGKGFAVVADEVRNLAQKSAEAAQNTTELIESSLMQVSKGEKLANNTNEAFANVASYAQDILQMVAKIAKASDEQSVSIVQISQSVDQISSVVQMNSATSEESAASSEELSSQAGIMKSLIDQFVLMDTSNQRASHMEAASSMYEISSKPSAYETSMEDDISFHYGDKY